LKEETQDRTMWRTGFGIGCGPVVRQTAELMNECCRFGVTKETDILVRVMSYPYFFCGQKMANCVLMALKKLYVTDSKYTAPK